MGTKCAKRFPKAIYLCFLSARVFSPGFWLAMINTAGHLTLISSSDVSRMLCVRGGWEAWAAWCSLCPSSACSTTSAVPELWNSPMLGSASLISMWFSVTWRGFPLEIFVPSWCSDGRPLRSVLSIYICIFVFATRLRARWHFAYSPDLILWHLPWKGAGTDVHSLTPCFHRRKQTAGSRNEQSWQRVIISKDFEIWLSEWMVCLQM